MSSMTLHLDPSAKIAGYIDAAVGVVTNCIDRVADTLGFTSPAQTDSGDFEQQAIKNLNIPPEVIRQLRQAGINIETLNAGQFQAAAISFEADGTVFDDHEGHTFSDKLTIYPHELSSREERKKSPLAPSPGAGASDHFFRNLVAKTDSDACCILNH